MTSDHKTRNGSAEVSAEIRRQIMHGELSGGERLPAERSLCEIYQVSRGTIREALMKLARDDLLEIKPGSGTYVKSNANTPLPQAIENARPLELIDTRFALEPHICRLAVLHAERSDFTRLENIITHMEDHADDPVIFGETDTAFHSALAQSTGNNLLIWIIAQIKTVRGQNEWHRMRQLTLTSSVIATYNQQHREILEAIKQREPETAAGAMKAHLETARQSLMRISDI